MVDFISRWFMVFVVEIHWLKIKVYLMSHYGHDTIVYGSSSIFSQYIHTFYCISLHWNKAMLWKSANKSQFLVTMSIDKTLHLLTKFYILSIISTVCIILSQIAQIINPYVIICSHKSCILWRYQCCTFTPSQTRY